MALISRPFDGWSVQNKNANIDTYRINISVLICVAITTMIQFDYSYPQKGKGVHRGFTANNGGVQPIIGSFPSRYLL